MQTPFTHNVETSLTQCTTLSLVILDSYIQKDTKTHQHLLSSSNTIESAIQKLLSSKKGDNHYTFEQ